MHHRRSTRARALVGVLAACAAVCEGGNAPPAAVAPYVAPSFQEASVVPALLGEYDVPTSVSVGTKIKDKTDVFLSLIKSPTGGIKGLITAAGKVSNRDLTITSTVDDKGNLEAIVRDKGIAKGLAIKLAGNNKGKDLTDFAADISADYTFSNPMGPAGFTGRVGMKDSHLTMSGVVGHGAALVGVFSEFDAELGTLTEPALLASYTGSSYSLIAQGKAGGGNARVTFEQRITSSLAVAAGLFCTGNSLRTGNAFTLAVQNVFDGGLQVRGKLDSSSQTASILGTAKDVLPHTVVHASAKVTKSGEPTFGISAKYNPPLNF